MIKLMTHFPKGGGPGVFMRRLTKYMKENNMVRFVDRKPDVYLSTIWSGDVPKNCRWVHRAASVYYDSVARRKGKTLNQKIYSSLQRANYVIYQSKFAKKLHNKVIKIDPPRFKIIYNGFNLSDYDHVEPRILNGKNVFVACSNWTNYIKRGEFIVKNFSKIETDNLHLYMIGDYTNHTFPSYNSKKKNITLLGGFNTDKIVAILKARPYFVHLSYAEACSNVVIEALSCGCPVLCNNIGSTPEIVGDDGMRVSCDSKFIYKRRPVAISMAHPERVISAFKEMPKKEWNITRPDLSMDICAKKYLGVFEEVLS